MYNLYLHVSVNGGSWTVQMWEVLHVDVILVMLVVGC